MQSTIETSTINAGAAVQAVKKKVEKTMFLAVLELEKSRDYIKRLNKAVKGDLKGAEKQVCQEVTKGIKEAKDILNKKDFVGKEVLNLFLDGCEKLTNDIVKGAIGHTGGCVDMVMGLADRTVKVIGDVIDAVNPAPNQLTVSQIIKKVEDGSIKLTTNLQKGNYGEMKMDQYYSKQGYVRISIDRVMSLNEPAHQGLDGVYYNVDKQKGEPTYIIAEAKYNQSKLGYTKYDGKQMSDRWILGGNRIENAVGEMFVKDVRENVIIGNCEKQVVHVFQDGTCKVEIVK